MIVNPRKGPRRDRRGRGVRGPLAWPAVPGMTSPSQRFDELVLDSAERIEAHLGRSLDPAELAVEDVPPSDPAAWEDGVPLGRLFPSEGRTPPRIVVYRRPIETRAADERELAQLVQHVVSEQVAAMLGLDPEDLGPG